MNFFKTVFSDDPDPPQSESVSINAPPNNDQLHDSDPNSPPIDPQSELTPPTDISGAGAWNFGGLIQTLTSKSESIIETYRRDLQEFSTGLKKEIEVAQGSLGTVTHVIDEFGNTVVKGTAQIISQGKDAILAVDLDSDSDNSNNTPKHRLSNISDKSLNSKRYSRFDAMVRAIQGDASTYTEGPEDLGEYNKWKSEFSLDGKSEEIEDFLSENDAMESVYKRIVPNNVDHETFWYRYYYKVYRLEKAEDVRARLVRRMSREEEDLSWDVEDDDDHDDSDNEEGETKPEFVTNKEIDGESKGKMVDINSQTGSSGTSNEEGTKRLNAEEVQNTGEEGSKVEKKDSLAQSEELGDKTDKSVEGSQVEKSGVVHEVGDEKKEAIEEAGVGNASKSEVDNVVNKNDSAAKSEEKEITEKKTDDAKSTNKNNESSKVGSQHSAQDDEEEDLGWDEIEDLSSIDEKKATESGSRSEVDLRKRLSAAEAEEDLGWDIEDDDEPAKP